MRTLAVPTSLSLPSYRPTCQCGPLPTFQSPPSHCATVPLGPICSLASRQAWHAGGCRPRGYAHSGCPRNPPQGVRPFTLSQEPPPGGTPIHIAPVPPPGVWSATASSAGPPGSQVSPFLVVKFWGFSTIVLSRERECGLSSVSHSDFVCTVAHCMLYLGRNLALLNYQCQKCAKVDISRMQWAQTI